MSISIRTKVHTFTTNNRLTPEPSWTIVNLAGRVDAFADKRTVAGLKMLAPTPGSWIALDLSQCEFLSIWALKEVAAWAIEQQRMLGRFVILKPNESIRRQLDVFVGQGLVIYQDWEALEIETFYRLQREAAVQEVQRQP